jgi:hypothetical protein
VAGDTSSAASMIVSPDSQTLYIDGGGILYAYNIANGTQIGWMPNLTVESISGGSDVGPSANPNLQAFDNTGLIAGPMEGRCRLSRHIHAPDSSGGQPIPE